MVRLRKQFRGLFTGRMLEVESQEGHVWVCAALA